MNKSLGQDLLSSARDGLGNHLGLTTCHLPIYLMSVHWAMDRDKVIQSPQAVAMSGLLT